MDTIKTPGSTYKIPFHDCDMFGHLNNARYIDYFIQARQDHLIDTYNFDTKEYYAKKLGWVVRSHEIRFIRPVTLDEVIFIESSLLSVNEHGLYVEMLMFDKRKTHLKAIMRTELTFVSLLDGRRRQHDADLMDWALPLVNEMVDCNAPLDERIQQVQSSLQRLSEC